MMKYRVMLVDDHKLFRKGLRMLIDALDHFEVIGEAANGREFLDLLEQEQGVPDVVMLDIAMPVMDGIEAARLALLQYPALKIITISMFDDPLHYQTMLTVGVKGFLLKTTDPDEVKTAIETVVEGGTWFSVTELTGNRQDS